jgi:hypothetical protein
MPKSLVHLKYIMFDCCNMMCLENLYELRSVADYIIGSPAEIPTAVLPTTRSCPTCLARVSSIPT